MGFQDEAGGVIINSQEPGRGFGKGPVMETVVRNENSYNPAQP